MIPNTTMPKITKGQIPFAVAIKYEIINTPYE